MQITSAAVGLVGRRLMHRDLSCGSNYTGYRSDGLETETPPTAMKPWD